MKKSLILLLFIVLILFIGCTSNNESVSRETQTSQIDCSTLKFSSGNLIYSVEDATSQFGGKWSTPGINLNFLAENDIGNCMYNLYLGKELITVQQVTPDMVESVIKQDFTSNEQVKTTIKEVNNVGDKAVFEYLGENSGSPMFYVQKNNKAVSIYCTIPQCDHNEANYILIGQNIASKL